MTPHDLKSYGIPAERAPMPRALVNWCIGLVVLIGLLTAFASVVDVADRMVIMSRAEFDKHVATERIKAAQEMAEAIDPGTCGWRDMFDPRRQPKARKGAM